MENVIFDFTPEFQMLISFLYPRLVWAAMSRGDQILFFEVWVHQQPQPSLKGFFLMKVKWGEKFVSENKMKSHAHYRTLAQPVKVKNINSQLTDDFFKAKKALFDFAQNCR